MTYAVPEIVILAAGGHAAEVYAYLADLGPADAKVHLLGLIDDGKLVGEWEGSRIIGGFDALSQVLAERGGLPLGYIAAIGNNRLRQQLVARAEQTAAGRPLFPWTLRHPSAWVGRGVEIGAGTLLAPGSLVTTRSHIGRHCILNIKASVSHDCTVGDYVNLNPGATICGKVRIGEGAYIGAGATIVPDVSVGPWTTVGAGAVVFRDLPPNVTAVGVPARIIKKHELHQP